MTELSITRHENRISVVGDMRTPADRQRLSDRVDELLQIGIDEAIVDVSHAKYLDTAALTCLVTMSRRCIDRGTQLILEGANPETLEQLRVTGIDRVLQAHGTRVAPADSGDSTGAAT